MTTTTAAATYKDTQLLINNEWCAAASGKTLDVVNPATGKVIGKVAHAGIPDLDLDHALATAHAGFDASSCACWHQTGSSITTSDSGYATQGRM